MARRNKFNLQGLTFVGLVKDLRQNQELVKQHVELVVVLVSRLYDKDLS